MDRPFRVAWLNEPHCDCHICVDFICRPMKTPPTLIEQRATRWHGAFDWLKKKFFFLFHHVTQHDAAINWWWKIKKKKINKKKRKRNKMAGWKTGRGCATRRRRHTRAQATPTPDKSLSFSRGSYVQKLGNNFWEISFLSFRKRCPFVELRTTRSGHTFFV